MARPVPQRHQQLPRRAGVVPAHRRHRLAPPAWPARLAWFWTLNGMLTEAIQHLERLVDIDDVPPPIRAKCLWGYALLAASLGRLETARDAGYRAARPRSPLRRRRQPPTGSTPPPSPSGRSATTSDRSRPTARRSALLDKLDDRWGLAVCHVLQARTLFDLDDPAAAAVARTGVDHARRAGTSTCSASPSPRSPRSPSPVATLRAPCRLPPKRSISKNGSPTPKASSPRLHVLGHAHRISRRARCRPAASPPRPRPRLRRIGHAAAMCEAVEDLARDEATNAARPRRHAAAGRTARADSSAVCPCVNVTPEELAALEHSVSRTAEPAGTVTGRSAISWRR